MSTKPLRRTERGEAPLQRGAMGFPCSRVVEEQHGAGCPLRAPLAVCPRCIFVTCSISICGESRHQGLRSCRRETRAFKGTFYSWQEKGDAFILILLTRSVYPQPPLQNNQEPTDFLAEVSFGEVNHAEFLMWVMLLQQICQHEAFPTSKPFFFKGITIPSLELLQATGEVLFFLLVKLCCCATPAPGSDPQPCPFVTLQLVQLLVCHF